MTQGLIAQRTGVPAPDPIDLVQAVGAFAEAWARFGIVARASAAERLRVKREAHADPAAILEAWGHTQALMGGATVKLEEAANELLPMLRHVARAFNLIGLELEKEAPGQEA